MDANVDKEGLTNVFPSNSKCQNDADDKTTKDEKKLEKVVTGKVRKQKRGLGKRVSEVMLEDDTKSVGSYIFYDVLIPSAKDLISEMVGGGIEMLLFGERRGRTTRGGGRHSGRAVTSYGSYFNPGNGSRDPRDRGRDISRAGRTKHDFDEIVIDTRGEAEEVLALLVDMTIDYGMATVGDLYDLVGITSNFTDNKYGWTELRSANIIRARGGGYIINLPRPRPLD